MFIIASVRLYVWISCCKDSLRSAEGHSMHFLYYSYCANEQPPGGTWKIPQSFFFHIHLIKWTVHEESFYSHVAFQHWCLVFSPRGEVEKEDCCILVSFDSLNSVCVCVCVCADTARGIPHVLAPQLSWNSHRRDRQYKMSGKKQTPPGSGAGRVLRGPVLV